MNTVHYCTNYMDVLAKYTSMFNATVSDIGNMCISRCQSDDKNQQIIEFLNKEFGLTMSNDRNLSTTENKTTLREFSSKFYPEMHSKPGTYGYLIEKYTFSATTSQPIVSILEIGDDDAGNDDCERVVEIMNES
ncbi:hypothetical protein PV328_004120 [Microctonus aethiopoides]|uniref:Uncharacterized protein n=1 Tax=Microctonus aethiopoides TaxID=144406 RepID=A0AA39F9U7_9HYME|nr:hypothetical protein PV328_004120 [Microctonus aethiopoides]